MKDLLILVIKDKKFIIRTIIRFSFMLLIGFTILITSNFHKHCVKVVFNENNPSVITVPETTKGTETSESQNTETETSFDVTEESETTQDSNLTKDLISFDVFAIYKDKAYEYYGYSDSSAKKYAENLNFLAKELDGISTVYSLVAPTSMGIQFPDKLSDYSFSDDQKSSTVKIHSYLDNSVKKINAFDNLYSHKHEYIYFSTEHHWTALGAYYAYQAFCSEKGIQPISIEEYETDIFDGFYGSFYRSSEQHEALSEPDFIKVYYPITEDIVFKFNEIDGTQYIWKLINDVSNYPSSDKFSTFAGSDHPYSVIKNNQIKNGENCVVIKDSYGNPFVPFLTDHYENVHIIDYRYWEGNLIEFSKQNNIDDIIFCNNISMLRSSYTTSLIQKILK